MLLRVPALFPWTFNSPCPFAGDDVVHPPKVPFFLSVVSGNLQLEKSLHIATPRPFFFSFFVEREGFFFFPQFSV